MRKASRWLCSANSGLPRQRCSSPSNPVDRGADERDPDVLPPSRTRLRTPPRLLPLPRSVGDDLRHEPPPHRSHHRFLEDRMSENPQVKAILEHIETRERELADQAGQFW